MAAITRLNPSTAAPYASGEACVAAIKAETAKLANASGVGRPLPLAYASSWGFVDIPMAEQWQMIQDGNPLVLTFTYSQEATNLTYPDTATLTAIGNSGIPIALQSGDWESLLLGTRILETLAFTGLAWYEKGIGDRLDGTASGYLTSIPVYSVGQTEEESLAAWREVGRLWVKSWSYNDATKSEPRFWDQAVIKDHLEQYIPNPARVIWASNNEASKVKAFIGPNPGEQLASSKSFVDHYGSPPYEPGNSYHDDLRFLAKVTADGFIARYNAMNTAMNDELTAWKDKTTFIYYNDGEHIIGEQTGWSGWSTGVFKYRETPEEAKQEGDHEGYYLFTNVGGGATMPEIYDNDWQGNWRNHRLLGHHYKAMNATIHTEANIERNPNCWNEAIVWDGRAGDYYHYIFNSVPSTKYYYRLIITSTTVTNSPRYFSVYSQATHATVRMNSTASTPNATMYAYYEWERDPPGAIANLQIGDEPLTDSFVIAIRDALTGWTQEQLVTVNVTVRPSYPVAVCESTYALMIPPLPNKQKIYWEYDGVRYTPETYEGWIQYILWVLRPRALREFRDVVSTTAPCWDWTRKVVDVCNRVHNDATLQRFWKFGTLVDDVAWLRSQTQYWCKDPTTKVVGPIGSPFWLNIPAIYDEKPRWFHLRTNYTPPFNMVYYGGPFLDVGGMTGSTTPYTEYPIWTMALVLGEAPTREWLVYAHTTGLPAYGDTLNDVVLTIPDYGDVELGTVTLAGDFYHIVEGSAQVARPTSDVTTTGWVAVPTGDYYATLDEETPSDADYIYTVTPGTVIEGRFSTLSDPGSAAHVIKYRGRGNYTFAIVQGTTVIESWEENDATYTDHSRLMTNASSITDYTDLRWRITAGS